MSDDQPKHFFRVYMGDAHESLGVPQYGNFVVRESSRDIPEFVGKMEPVHGDVERYFEEAISNSHSKSGEFYGRSEDGKYYFYCATIKSSTLNSRNHSYIHLISTKLSKGLKEDEFRHSVVLHTYIKQSVNNTVWNPPPLESAEELKSYFSLMLWDYVRSINEAIRIQYAEADVARRELVLKGGGFAVLVTFVLLVVGYLKYDNLEQNAKKHEVEAIKKTEREYASKTSNRLQDFIFDPWDVEYVVLQRTLVQLGIKNGCYSYVDGVQEQQAYVDGVQVQQNEICILGEARKLLGFNGVYEQEVLDLVKKEASCYLKNGKGDNGVVYDCRGDEYFAEHCQDFAKSMDSGDVHDIARQYEGRTTDEIAHTLLERAPSLMSEYWHMAFFEYANYTALPPSSSDVSKEQRTDLYRTWYEEYMMPTLPDPSKPRVNSNVREKGNREGLVANAMYVQYQPLLVLGLCQSHFSGFLHNPGGHCPENLADATINRYTGKPKLFPRPTQLFSCELQKAFKKTRGYERSHFKKVAWVGSDGESLDVFCKELLLSAGEGSDSLESVDPLK